jgi:nicotinamidase-related amidase
MIALLLLDLQCDFMQSSGRLPVGEKRAIAVIDCISRLLTAAPDKGLHPIFITNEFSPSDRVGNFFRNRSAIRGSAGAAIDPRIMAAGRPIFTKEKSDAFSNPELVTYLGAHEMTHLVIAGVFAEGCVRATAKEAVRRGYHVSVVSDGVESDKDWKKRFGLWSMRRSGARVLTSDEFFKKKAEVRS